MFSTAIARPFSFAKGVCSIWYVGTNSMRILLSVGAEMNVWSLWMRDEILGEISVRHTTVSVERRSNRDTTAGGLWKCIKFLAKKLQAKAFRRSGNAKKCCVLRVRRPTCFDSSMCMYSPSSYYPLVGNPFVVTVFASMWYGSFFFTLLLRHRSGKQKGQEEVENHTMWMSSFRCHMVMTRCYDPTGRSIGRCDGRKR